MDKIQKVMVNINKLSSELKIVNDRIDSYISYFEKIKDKTDIKFYISIYSRNDIEEDKNLFFKQFDLNFESNNAIKPFCLSFENSSIEFSLQKIPFSLLFSFTKILSDIEKNFGLDNIKQDIKKSSKLYKEIQKKYKDISYSSSNFNSNSTIILSSFKDVVKKQIRDTSKEYESAYLSFRRHNKEEKLEIILKFYEESNYFQLKLPKLEIIKQISTEKYLKEGFTFKIFQIVFLELFFNENKTFFDHFNIDEKYIRLIDNYHLKDFNSESLYLTAIRSGLYFYDINQEYIKILAEKIMIDKQINNF